ncbi:uncharacterized protein [Ptychodera flava]|uniref:uncharacterized protein isoform X1 n=1 Tax=Ptychodera flava TaxID=63121 RepID=UPI00396A1297
MPMHFVQLSLNPNITGDLPIELCNKTNLTVLSVGETAITGAIPECLGENKPHLRFLDFEYTKMKSRYPESLLELKAIQWLHMSQMGLYGELPVNFGENYPILKEIIMANNNVTGILPESVGYLKNLTLFDMSFNAIHGKIPENFTVLQNLSSFSLKGNQITSLPSKAFEYETLRYLDLSQNPLNATFLDVCTFIQACSQLAWLNLSDTGLKGHLDRALYNFVYMNSIDLSHNRLSGRIPLTTRDMPFLTNFDLSNNNLRGELPSTYVIMSALRYLNIRNNAHMRSHSGRLDSGLFAIDGDNMVNAKSGNFSCPSVSLVKRNTAECFVDMDPNYYDYHQCTCNEHFFGERGRCRRCLDRGTCPGKAVVSNMTWPSNYWPSPSPTNVGRFEKCSVSEAEEPVCNVNGTCQCHLHINEYKNEENIVCDEVHSKVMCSVIEHILERLTVTLFERRLSVQ